MPGGRPSRDAIYRRLDEAVRELNDQLGGLPPPGAAADIWIDIWHQEAHNSTAIEGNTLVFSEVTRLLDEGKAAGGKPLKEYLEVQGYAAAANWVYRQALRPEDWVAGELVSLQEVRHVHYLALTPVWDVAPHESAYDAESPGNWRQHDIAEFSGGMKPPSFTEIDYAMGDWVSEACSIREPRAAPLPEKLAKLHSAFERTHPFLDGNGRVGRLVLNLLLVRLGYPPAVVYKRERERYLRALRRADAGDPGPLGELIARSVTDNLYRFVLPAIARDDRLVPLASLATQDLAESALRIAAVRGRLRAQKGSDGVWRSTRKWVDDYAAARWRRN